MTKIEEKPTSSREEENDCWPSNIQFWFEREWNFVFKVNFSLFCYSMLFFLFEQKDVFGYWITKQWSVLSVVNWHSLFIFTWFGTHLWMVVVERYKRKFQESLMAKVLWVNYFNWKHFITFRKYKRVEILS